MRVTPEVLKGFVGSVLSAKFDNAVATPAFHEEAWALCCSNKRMVAISAPRAHAKTTGITVAYGLATLLFRERRFMVLVSDTESQSAGFLGLFKDHILDNPIVAELFGIVRNPDGRVVPIKDTETDLIIQMEDGHMFRILAKGAEQKLRGLNWKGTRPDIVLCDDMENDELVMNKDRREKMRIWFYSALLPCLSSTGIIRIVGTILHMDSLLERLMPKPHSKWSRQEPLKLWSEQSVAGGWWSIKYRAHTPDFDQLLWPENYDKQWFVEKRDGFIAQGLPDKYSQEYLNLPLDESVSYFKRNDFKYVDEDDRKLGLKYYITVDVAISEAERADYSVFLVAGVDEYKRIHVKNVIRERLDARDIVDTIIELQRVYDPEAIGIEDMQVSKSIGPFLREEMLRTNVWPNLVQLKHGGKDKIARARSIQARMRAGAVKFEKGADWYQDFEDELTRFPRDTHDDQVDAFAYLGMMLNMLIEAPTREELDEEEYEYELEQSGFDGRNSVTGY
jgi:predicted phage terminase large subunit-like protein